MAENIFKQARLKAAEKDGRFKTAAKAAFELHDMSREKLLMIEQEDSNKRQADPSAFDVVEMSQAYGAPELCDYYCTQICPIGMGRTQLIYGSLGEISARLMSSLHFLENANDEIHRILADSKVTDDEKAEFRSIIQTLRDFSYSADSLELWAQKNGIID